MRNRTNKIKISAAMQQQIADQRRDGYVLMPSSFMEGVSDASMEQFVNFRPTAMAQGGVTDAAPRDAIFAAGGITSTARISVPVSDKKGHNLGLGYIPWGAANNLPNIVALVNSKLVYTALCVKFNIDVMCGLGVEPIFSYHNTVGCNENEDSLSYAHAGSYLLHRIDRERSRMFNILREHECIPEEEQSDASHASASPSVPDVRPALPLPIPLPSSDENEADVSEQAEQARLLDSLHASDGQGYKRMADHILDDMVLAHRASIKRMEREYRQWSKTDRALRTFRRRHNSAQFAHDVATDLYQFNIAFVEVQLSQEASTQTNPTLWKPSIVGLRHRDALTCRLEAWDEEGVSRHVYVSNQWLDPANSTLLQNATAGSIGSTTAPLDIAMLPALDPHCPADDLERQLRQFRNTAASAIARYEHALQACAEGQGPDDVQMEALKREADYYLDPTHRPTRFILPITYRTSGRFYYPQPAYWSLFRDIYQYAENIIRDRAVRKRNENMFTYVLYVHQGYLDRLTNQQKAQQTEEERKRIKMDEINKIKRFLSDKQNNGSTLAAVTFTGHDGKDHDAFRVERIDYANTKQNAEADKTEITDLASIIAFGHECHPDLIGALPGGASSSGGTYQREMLLITQAKKANMQQLMLQPYCLMRDFMRFDSRLDYKIRQKTLTTLDMSKTGLIEE